MKRPGLTPAMRRAIRDTWNASVPMIDKLRAAGLWDNRITPRGHAAIAAEPMTPAEYHLLVRIADREVPLGCSDLATGRRLAGKGWAFLRTVAGGEVCASIGDTGRTQLHNIRAAMPGPWVPHSHSDATNTDEG